MGISCNHDPDLCTGWTDHRNIFELHADLSIYRSVIYSTVGTELAKIILIFLCCIFKYRSVHIEDAHPFIFVLNRVVDTLIGVFLALIVNTVHLPRGKNTDVLYVSGIEDVLLTGREPLTDYSKVELNRIIDTGANFTVATIKTPASVMESLSDIHLKLPIIAMDGAVLYDLNENRYLKTYPMSYKQAEKIMEILRKEDVNFFINVVVEDVLIIYYHHLENEAETQIYKQMRRSPHPQLCKKKSSRRGRGCLFYDDRSDREDQRNL